MVTTETFSNAEIYAGNCDGTFTSTPTIYGAGDISVSVTLRDVDGDGRLDLVAGGDYFGNVIGSGDDAGNLLSVLKGDGQGGFTTAQVFRGLPGMYSLAFLSLDGASVPSVLAVNQNTDAITLFKNAGTGDFGMPRGEAIGYEGGVANAPYGGFLVADINGDHLPDLVNIDVPQYASGNYELSATVNLGNGHFAPPTRIVGQKRQPIGSAGRLLAFGFVPFGILLAMPPSRKRTATRLIVGLFLLTLVLSLQACGGGGGGSSTGRTTQPSSYNVSVTGNASGDKHTANFTLVIQ